MNSSPSAPIAGKEPPDSQRIDKWLWCARFFKTRTLASKIVSNGQIRLTRDGATQRVEKPSFLIKAEDELAFAIGEHLKVIKILHCGTRRGPAAEAKLLYIDNSPPPPPRKEKPVDVFAREKGAGRPTKKERRELDRLKKPT